MNQQSTYSSRLQLYFLSLGVFLLPGLFLFIQKGYTDSFLVANGLHTPFFDVLMPHLTHIGEGALLTGIFALFMRKQAPALVASLTIAMILVLVIVSPLKHQLFDSWGRPLTYFSKESIHYIAPIDLYAHAFPSGHSTAAACMLAFFALAANKGWGILLAFIAAVAAYSRVYLGVHFVGDILAGCLLGVLIAAGVFYFIFPRLDLYFEKGSPNNKKWQIIFLILAILTIGISLFELIRTYYL